MGKKSRRNKGKSLTTTPPASTQQPQQVPPTTNTPTAASSQTPPQPTTTTNEPPLFYPSDGPSDIELLQTTSPTLQNKLNQLTTLGQANDRAAFVNAFVPLDLSPSDTQAYLQDLTTAPEAESQWINLISEIAAIRCGKGVDRIEGDQVTRAVFYFCHPLLEKCDREVAFTCVDGKWREEG